MGNGTSSGTNNNNNNKQSNSSIRRRASAGANAGSAASSLRRRNADSATAGDQPSKASMSRSASGTDITEKHYTQFVPLEKLAKVSVTAPQCVRVYVQMLFVIIMVIIYANIFFFFNFLIVKVTNEQSYFLK